MDHLPTGTVMEVKAMKAVAPLLLVLLLVPITNVTAQGTDPVSVLERYFAADDASNVEAAMAFYADDAVITATRGQKIVGKDAIRRFEQANVSAGIQGVLKRTFHVTGDAVTWENGITSDFFVKLGVAPMKVSGRAVVQNGKIKSFAFYYRDMTNTRLALRRWTRR